MCHIFEPEVLSCIAFCVPQDTCFVILIHGKCGSCTFIIHNIYLVIRLIDALKEDTIIRFIDFNIMCVKSVIYCCDRDNVLLRETISVI